jgi:hypothetical protein
MTGMLKNNRYPRQEPLSIVVTILESGAVRMVVDEVDGKFPRFQVVDVLQVRLLGVSVCMLLPSNLSIYIPP